MNCGRKENLEVIKKKICVFLLLFGRKDETKKNIKLTRDILGSKMP